MKTIGKVIFNKTLFIILTIAIMIFSNFAPIISWAIENSGTTEETEDEYVKFDLAWDDDTTEITRDAGTIGAKFSIQVDTLDSFTGFRIEVERTDKVSVAYNNKGEYFGNSSSASQIQYFNNIPGGTRLDGWINFTFATSENFSDYSKNLVVKLIGAYEVDGEEFNVEIIKSLKANIKTQDIISYHSADFAIEGNTPKLYTSSNNEILYSVSRIEETYRISYDVKNSELTTLNIELNRKSSNNDNIYYPDEVTFSKSNFSLTKVEDGKYMATKGEEHDEYESTNIFNISRGTSNNNFAILNVTYLIIHPEEDVGTTTTAKIDLISKGWTVSTNINGTSSSKTTIERGNNTSRYYDLYRYTPGGTSWGNSEIDGMKGVDRADIKRLAHQNSTLELKYMTKFSYVNGIDIEGNTKITQGGAKIQYYSSRNIEKDLNENEMYVKEIQLWSMKKGDDVWIKFYKKDATEPFFTATANNLKYTCPEGEKIGDFYAVLSNTLINRYMGWDTTYEISSNALKESGLLEQEIENINTITLEQTSDRGANIFTSKRYAIFNIRRDFGQIVADFEINKEETNLNSTTSDIAKKIRGTIRLDFLGMKNNPDSVIAYENVITNPTLYVVLPDEFDFEINSIDISGNNSNIKNWRIKKCNGENVLEINCLGSCTGEHVTIDYHRRLKPNVTVQTRYLEAYMQTDEGIYVNTSLDKNDYNEDGNTEDDLGYSRLNYSIEYNRQIQIKGGAYDAFGEVQNYDVNQKPGEKAKYQLRIENNYNTIKDINVIARVPFIGNKTIVGSNLLDLGTTCSLENLNNIKAYLECDGKRSEINSNNYTIKYSSDETANFESTFIEGEEQKSTAKTIQIEFLEDYNLDDGYNIMIEYEMDVPSDAVEGLVASQIFAVKYKEENNNEQTQESIKNNIIVGNTDGKVEIIKEFLDSTNSPSLKNIEFKMTDMNDETRYYTGLTDENGHLIFNDIPAGEYIVTEETEFENYEPEASKYIKITNGEQYTEETGNAVNFKNKIKLGKVELIKRWADSKEAIHDISFIVSGNNAGEKEFSKNYDTITRDVDSEGYGVSKFIGYIPYGTYTVEENSSIYGWYSDDEEHFEVGESPVSVIIQNKVTKGTLKIVKTVPEGETVEGLTFKITGIGDVSYTTKEGQTVTFEKDIEVQVNEENENVIIAEDKRTATITLEDFAVGTYTVEEINMPTITTGNETITKYISVKKSVTIPDENGKVTQVFVKNEHKTGTLRINVTATEGADLEQFKVRVSGTSYYGNYISEESNVSNTGKIEFKEIEIGNYIVEEVDTKEINGKIYTTNPDGFEVTYEPEDANSAGVEIKYNNITDVNIDNKYTGKGAIKIQKSLEDENDISKTQGIKFAIIGKDQIGNDVNEEITIGEDGTGISNLIPAGTYLLSEVGSTVSDIYELVEDKEITIKTEDTLENPQVLTIENKLAEGKIIMETETVSGGYPPSPVTYEVTKVNDNLQAEGEPVVVDGDSKSKAELDNLKGGKYLVKQIEVPEGYKKDEDQIVKVTRDSFGYALFLIDKEKEEEFDDTTVIIQKDLLNDEGEIATTDNFVEAKLDIKESYSFEVKLQNTETKETYYTFVENNKIDTIKNLPYGTYEVEEVYKPKYKMLEITGEDITKDEVTGKYTFTLSRTKNKISLTIKNKIDKNFGFGGQDSKDNLSKILIEEIEQQKITKARIYVRDEKNNKISDAEFKLYDSQGQALKLIGSSGVYVISEEGNEAITPVNGLITLKALPVGDYLLVNERVSSNFLQAYDKNVTVYEDAVGITRIELLRNIPRGTLRLSTTYVADTGETKYAPKSKYTIYNPTTDQKLTFIRKADGKYYRSNLPNATEIITLNAGYIDVQGIEANISYKVGLVGLTEKYGIVKDEPEAVTIEEGIRKDIELSVEKRQPKFVDIVQEHNRIYSLDENGKLWGYGVNYYSYYNIEKNYQLQCISDKVSEIENVEFKKIGKAIAYKNTTQLGLVYGIDIEGNIWDLSKEPVCKGNLFGEKNINIQKLDILYYSDRLSSKNMCDIFALDEDGKIWCWNELFNSYSSVIQTLPEISTTPICVSENTELKNVRIKDFDSLMYNMNNCEKFGNGIMALDEEGKVWVWNARDERGFGYNEPVCISDMENSNIQNRKIVKIAADYQIGLLIDDQNKLWAVGDGELNFKKSEMNGEYWNPICLNNDNDENLFNGLGIIDINCSSETCFAIDEIGNLWGWGLLINLDNNSTSIKTYVTPIYIKTYDPLRNVFTGGQGGAALDNDGDLWIWGPSSGTAIPAGNQYSGKAVTPVEIKLSRKSYFSIPEFTKVAAGYYNSVAIDKDGRVWTWGSSSSTYLLGLGYNNGRDIVKTTPQLVGGEYNAISHERIVDVSIGSTHVLALDSNGNVWGWGNCDAILGTKFSTVYEPVCLSEMNTHILYGKKIKKVEVGPNGDFDDAIAIDEDGILYRFKRNDSYCINERYEQLAGIKFVDVSVGGKSILAIDSDGRLWNVASTPSCMENMFDNKKIVSVSALKYNATYSQHCLAIDEDGNLWTWGYNNSNGQLGYVPRLGSENRTNPLCLTKEENSIKGKKIIKICTGQSMSLVVDSDGKIWTWGSNQYGQLGQNVYSSSSGIECINKDNGLKINDISVGNYYCLAADKNGDIWSWGNNANGSNITGVTGRSEGYTILPLKLNGKTYKYKEIKDKYENISDTMNVKYSVKNTSGKVDGYDTENMKQIKGVYISGGYAFIQLDNNGNLWTYGQNNQYGLLGDGTTNKRQDPKCINNMFENKKIDEILLFTNENGCVKDIDGGIWFWGYNGYGQCGTGTTDNVLEPTCVNEENGFVIEKIIKIGYSNIVQDIDGKIWCWGQNNNGQCGTGTTDNVLEPTKISGDNEIHIQNILKSGGTNILQDTEGRIWAWGENQYGECGAGTTEKVLEPACINEELGFIVEKIITSGSTNIIQDTEGRIWSWGNNSYGQCGTGTTENVLEPTCINEEPGFIIEEIITSGQTNIIQDTEGRIWTWGRNQYGQCGTGTTDNVLLPTKISKNNEIHKEKGILAGYTNIIQDTEGRIWTWGENSYGECGNGTTENVLEPTCINEENRFLVEKIISRDKTIIIQDTEGRIWFWGYDFLAEYKNPNEISTITCVNENNRFHVKDIILCSINTSQRYQGDPVSSNVILQDTEGRIWTWGKNSYGECGTGNNQKVLNPVCINEDTKITVEKVVSMNNPNVVQDTEGRIWIWGSNSWKYNSSGEIEPETTERWLQPTCISGENRIKIEKIIFSGNTMMVQDTEGRIWTWGNNSYGRCGNGSEERVSGISCINLGHPFKVERAIDMYSYVYSNSTLLIDTDGRIWTWGENKKGECGTGNTEKVLTPNCIESGSVNNFKGCNIEIKNEGVFVINEYNEAWIWNKSTQPTKINTIGNLSGIGIKELAMTNSGEIFALTTEGEIYSLSEDLSSADGPGVNLIESVYGTGPWVKGFMLIHDPKY